MLHFLALRRLQEYNGELKIINQRLRLYLIVICLTLAVVSPFPVQASTSGSISYPASFSNPLPITIPANTITVDISLSAEISGTATVTDPNGNIVTIIDVSGPGESTQMMVLSNAGEYSVSESYHLELTGSALTVVQTVTGDASANWSFSNSTPGSIGIFKASSDISLSIGQTSGNVSVSLSGMTATATNTSDIGPGESVSATLVGTWTVDSSVSIEPPTVVETGSINVSTNLAEASFSIYGPQYFSGSGTSWATTNALVGEYSITFNPVTGYITPPGSSGTLTKDGSLSFSGEYIALPTGNIEVTTNLENASFTLSGTAEYSGSGTSWMKVGAPIGRYTIKYDNVHGYGTPEQETKTLTEGETIRFSGNYFIIPTGTIEVTTNMDMASFTISGPEDYTGAGKLWAQTEVPLGEYTIRYSRIVGYQAPPPETKTLSQEGEVLSFTGEYSFLTGTLEVNTNLDEAVFSISGPAEYSGSGKSWLQQNAPVGDYTITYSPVAGYREPDQWTLTLNYGATIRFIGLYTPITGTIEVSTNLDKAAFSLSGPAEYSGSGKSWIETEALAGDYTIIYGSVDGYQTPPQQTLTLVKDGSIRFIGDYTPVPANIYSVEVSRDMAKAGDTIKVSVSGDAGAVVTFSIAGVVNDVPMTESTSTPGLYTREYIVPEGVNARDAAIIVRLVNTAGVEAVNMDKKVTIDTMPPPILSVDISGIPARMAGSVVTIEITGESGCIAFFSIVGIAENIPMPESGDSPGSYTGFYTALEGLNVRDAKVIIYLTDILENTSSDESKTASILTAPWDVNRDRAVDTLDIKLIGSNFGKEPVPDLDINGDGVIDILDLTLVALHYGERYGESGGILTNTAYETLAPLDEIQDYAFQNYPNPCNPGTWIPYMLSSEGEVTVTIYSANGQLIRRLDLGYKTPGIYIDKNSAAYWDGSNNSGEEVASGIYFYLLQSGDFSVTRKMLVAR